jgi:hypothetical protein
MSATAQWATERLVRTIKEDGNATQSVKPQKAHPLLAGPEAQRKDQHEVSIESLVVSG